MSQAVYADNRDLPRHDRDAPGVSERLHVSGGAAVLLAAIAAAVSLGTTAFLLAEDHLSGMPSVPAAVAAGAACLLSAASGAAGWVSGRRVQGQLAALRSAAAVAQSRPGDPGEAQDRRIVEVFVNMARRLQSLLHRSIGALDVLEAQTEDPDLLRRLFEVDHFATRMRRYTESLAVLGGAVTRRQWTRPVTVQDVLRAAIAEVEQYARVKIVPPVPGTLQPGAVADVIHLIAELIDNATKFSAPGTQPVLRAEQVTAGLVIEVEDRGLGIDAAEQQKLNEMFADPGSGGLEISRLLRDGRIGLYVVAALARRHGIHVQLRRNIFGGTQAIVVLPPRLADVGSQPRFARSSAPPGSPPPGAVAVDPPPGSTAGPAERPSLPRRDSSRSYMEPELLRRPATTANGPDDAVPTPDLMAAFREGVRRSDAEGGLNWFRNGADQSEASSEGTS
jgi:signal transduction histidine kinase